ncbi:1f47dd4f-d355-4a5c-bd94-1963d3cf71d2 [Sclerotinia trifoliorum]|uniref:1f47dd4f-d355-4a5c-bd94-1963d3cf71d2 n=1 Tax=Sclerotinia trifoliorum TaxID=28548 RepID=A0A8H2VSJ5_9HELO|nr:1f47dd4f-d355-4a5c-bd94-1963d3cf71d2 [Sclerotinia trifoliorum]
MSDNETASTPAQANGGMSQVEVDFLMCCLRNTTGGSIQGKIFKVDTQKVAQLLNYKNPRSVSNKVSSIKKKYNLPFGASSRTAEEMAVSKPGRVTLHQRRHLMQMVIMSPPFLPPFKNRVTKAKATPKPRVKKTPAKKSTKKVAAEDSEEEELSDVKDEEMEDAKRKSMNRYLHVISFQGLVLVLI